MLEDVKFRFETIHYLNTWFFKWSQLMISPFLLMNMYILTISLNDRCIFLLINLIKIFYLSIS
jgi:hypothetical protein